MEAVRNFLSPAPPVPPRTHLKNFPSSSSSSVSVLHEQTASMVTSMPIMSLARYFPTSVLLQEQRNESKALLHIVEEDRTFQSSVDRTETEAGITVLKGSNRVDPDQYIKDFKSQLLVLWSLKLPSIKTKEVPPSSSFMKSDKNQTKKIMDVEPCDVVALAKKALSASKQASLVEDNIEESLPRSLESTSLVDNPVEVGKTVRSTRLQERRSKKRRVSKPKVMDHETSSFGRADVHKKIKEAYDPNDALRLFLRGPETKQLLTVQEESQLIVKIQELMRLEEVKSKFQSQFDREPTLVEWSEAVGISCRDLQSQLHCGRSSREKLIFANFRLVVHIAKQYQDLGLSLQDLLQEGSMGLMRSVEKFKPHAGCRFSTYAYWWIRQAVRKTIFQHSRTIRLPDNVYGLLHKVREAKRLCIRDGHHSPSKEEIAARAGITVEKLGKLLYTARLPLSIQQPVWADQDATFQEITADTAIETPDVSVAKQFMRRHIRNLLGVLKPKERKIILLRYGIKDGKQKSLSEIGAVFGLSKERVRQLESRALYRLKQCLGGHGLDAYADLLI